VTFFPFFTNVQCHIIKNLLTSTVLEVRENIQPRGLAVLTSLSLGQYSKTSVGYFPVLPSLSVSKLSVLHCIAPHRIASHRIALYCIVDITKPRNSETKQRSNETPERNSETTRFILFLVKGINYI
jgi:hypothetical protein